MNIRDILKEKLTEEELSHLRTSFDIVGDIAIIEIPEEIQSRKKEIAKAILKVHKNVHNVCMKTGAREGEFRLRGVELIAGETTLTTHMESGCKILVDVAKAYFSVRESTERLRIAEMVKPKETVMVLFAGVGPYAIVIGKKRPDIGKIYALEINPDAVRLMEDNVRINRLQTKVFPVLGDARKDCKPYYGKCNRVIMPLPHTAHKFLDVAFHLLKKKGGTIHLYHIEDEGDVSTEVMDKMKEFSGKRKYEISEKRKVLPYSPGSYKFCIDVRVF
ncbi:MAG: class I SAM-dependent methyltransferase family protein [Candidatus Aenigmarchaeota archaeon]|nr:class I SAM-dependent methyltransferase family protein [Candidatus Aenigmarchaeota archaeon]